MAVVAPTTIREFLESVEWEGRDEATVAAVLKVLTDNGITVRSLLALCAGAVVVASTLQALSHMKKSKKNMLELPERGFNAGSVSRDWVRLQMWLCSFRRPEDLS